MYSKCTLLPLYVCIVCSFALLLDALLLVAARIGSQIKGEIGPVIPRREGNGLTKSEAHRIDYTLASGFGGAHADSGCPARGAQDVGRWRKLHGLPVLHDSFPDDVLEFCGNLQPGQVLWMDIPQSS